MSEANGKVCCNCRHCIRIGGDINPITCGCDIDDSWLSYVTVMTHWCRHWSRDKEQEGGNALPNDERSKTCAKCVSFSNTCRICRNKDMYKEQENENDD